MLSTFRHNLSLVLRVAARWQAQSFYAAAKLEEAAEPRRDLLSLAQRLVQNANDPRD
jgi:hypothetical protein